MEHPDEPGCVEQSVGHLTCKSEVLVTMPGLATYFCFSFRWFKRGSCQLLAKVCARSLVNRLGWLVVLGLTALVRQNRLGGLSLPRKSVARLNDRPDMTVPT